MAATRHTETSVTQKNAQAKITSYIEELRQDSINALLTEIVNNGLTPDNDSKHRVYSFDTHRSREICYFLFEGTVPSRHAALSLSLFGRSEIDYIDTVNTGSNNVFTQLQHRATDGLWNLCLEREYVHTTPAFENSSDYQEWEQRLNSSLVLILKVDEERLQEDNRKDMTSSNHIDMCTQRPFLPNEITAVLAPGMMYEQTKAHFGQDKTIKVDSLGKAVDLASCGISGSEYLQGPDYAKKLNQLLKDHKLEKPFAIHIMRFPTRRDFIKLDSHRKQASLDDMVERFVPNRTKEVDPYECALRRAAAFWFREDIEYLMYMLPALNVDATASTDNPKTINKTALFYAITRKNLNRDEKILIVKALLLANASMDISKELLPEINKFHPAIPMTIESIKQHEKQRFKEGVMNDERCKMFGFTNVGEYYKNKGFTSITQIRNEKSDLSIKR